MKVVPLTSTRAAAHLMMIALAAGMGGCTPARGSSPRTGADLVATSIRPWPTSGATTTLALMAPSGRASIYDNALVALLLTRRGRRLEAGRLLEALALLQRPDGALPFTFDARTWREADPYVRSGALAWVGYAGVAYLDAARSGPARDDIARMIHRIAGYLIERQVADEADPRAGLVTGGYGELSARIEHGALVQRFVSRAVDWASTEHNVDAFFFFRSLGRMTGQQEYLTAARRIADALLASAWSEELGQFAQGVSRTGRDKTLSLDCASWGALFLFAVGDDARARLALETIERRYASRDPRGVVGYKPYAEGPLVADEAIARARGLAGARWEDAEALWPEGSAGVALAALRAGDARRARAILDALDGLRHPSGALPTMTLDVPFEFDRSPSLAATTWGELVRDELDHPERSPWLWAP
jgi:hypothetical protein